MNRFLYFFLLISNTLIYSNITIAEPILSQKETDLYYATQKCERGTLACNKVHSKLLDILEKKINKYEYRLYPKIKYWAADGFSKSKDFKSKKKGFDLKYEIINDKNIAEEHYIKTYSYISLGWTHYLEINHLDNEKAFKFMSKAYKSGNAYAINNLAVMYEQGRVVKKDLRKAYNLYYEAAELGNYWSYGNIATFYNLGRGGIKKNYEKALRNAKLSSIADFGTDDFDLLSLLIKYKRTPKNIQEYLIWQENYLIENKYSPLFKSLAWSSGDVDDDKNKKSKKTLMTEYKWFYLCKKYSQTEYSITRCTQELNILNKIYLTKKEINLSVTKAEDWIEKNWN